MRTRILFVVMAMASIAVVPALPLGAQGAVPTCAGQPATIVGTDGDDRLAGTAGADVIVGLGGDDEIFGAKGNDIICGNAGADRILGGPGRDLIIGGYGDDRIIGSEGADDLRGGKGDDFISGRTGADIIRGDQGADRIAGNLGEDTCTVQNIDIQVTNCESGNSQTRSGTGDAVAQFDLPSSFSVVQHCFSADNCDDYYVARVFVDGAGSFDSLGVTALAADGSVIASYAGVGDVFEGAFLFKGEPATVEVDSAGGPWNITFVERTGVPIKQNSARGEGNEVYRVSSPVGTVGEANATWEATGNFAVIGLSPREGRDLLVNEVRFADRDAAPFTATAAIQPRVVIVQVLSSPDPWSVRLSS